MSAMRWCARCGVIFGAYEKKYGHQCEAVFYKTPRTSAEIIEHQQLNAAVQRPIKGVSKLPASRYKQRS